MSLVLMYTKPIEGLAPNLPTLEPRPLGSLGKAVAWVRKVEARDITSKIISFIMRFFVSAVLVCSVVGIAAVLAFVKEETLQTAYERYTKEHQKNLDIAQERISASFMAGRLDPLDFVNVPVSALTRSKMGRDLGICEEDLQTASDKELLRQVALKYPNFLQRYNFKILPA